MMQGTEHPITAGTERPQAASRNARNGGAPADVELEVHLLGTFEVLWLRGRVPIASASARALLAILALRGRPQLRDDLAAELWPELESARSSAALRQALWLLRGALSEAGADPNAIISAAEETVGLEPHLGIMVDVSRFEALLGDRPPRIEQAARLYRGDLLVARGNEYFARERDRLGDLFEDCLATLIRVRLARNDLDGAMAAARRLLDRDPLREEAHGALIEIYGRTGSRAQVARQYRRLRVVLEDELDVAPLPETEAVYRTALVRTHQRSFEVAQRMTMPSPGAAEQAAAGRGKDARETLHR